jgi:hypothetical protein
MKETYRAEWVKCGKKGCKKCPHGPYWYGYWREGKKLHKKYYGKVDPRDVKRDVETRKSHPHDDIFLRSKRTAAMAAAILGITQKFTEKEATMAFRKLVMLHHPDRGGNEEEFKRINAAWDWIKREQLWTWW